MSMTSALISVASAMSIRCRIFFVPCEAQRFTYSARTTGGAASLTGAPALDASPLALLGVATSPVDVVPAVLRAESEVAGLADPVLQAAEAATNRAASERAERVRRCGRGSMRLE